MYFSGLLYKIAPKKFRIFGVTHFMTRAALSSSAPFLAYFYNTLDLTKALAASGALFIGNFIVTGLDRLSKEKDIPATESQVDFIYRLGEFLDGHQERHKIADGDRDNSLRALLGIVEIYTRSITKSRKGEISVSLVLYKGSSNTRMSIRHRNPGNERPTKGDFPAADMLGHYVCQNGNFPQLINDVRFLSRKGVSSPTRSKPDYRSILFVPIEQTDGEVSRIRGFVSIDCRRPFTFYGNKDGDIILTCEPVFNHIRHLI